jgi:hypothetical protein
MRQLSWILSVAAVGIVSVAGTAHADPKIPARGGIGPAVQVMPPVRTQIMDNAKSTSTVSGLVQPGTTLRLKFNPEHTEVAASLWGKSTFTGGPVPSKPVEEEIATASFKVTKVDSLTVRGPVITPIKQDGQTWQPLMRAEAK